MISDIRNAIDAVPFVPFTIHTTNGRAFRVPTVDHIAVPPAGGRVFIFGDNEGDYDVLLPLHIAQLSMESGKSTSSAGT